MKTLRRASRVVLLVIALFTIQQLIERDLKRARLKRELNQCLDSTEWSDAECDSCWTATYKNEFNLMMEELDNVGR